MFKSYRGAIAYVRVVNGELTPNMRMKLYSSGKSFEVEEVGILQLRQIKKSKLSVGEVGYVIGGIKQVSDTKVGDTITDAAKPSDTPLPGFRDVKPMVFSGLYPSEAESYEELRKALERLKLNDSSLNYEPETSIALGFGFRCGFLGLLHMEIVQERLEREYDLDLITTVPNVEYKVIKKDGDVLMVENPAQMPSPGDIEHIEEPYISAGILTPNDYIGNIMQLAQDRRGVYKTTDYRWYKSYELKLKWKPQQKQDQRITP